jgi:hypothetical protein
LAGILGGRGLLWRIAPLFMLPLLGGLAMALFF